MRLYTTKNIKNIHHILTIHSPIFNELLKLNPNLYFCITKLIKTLSEKENKRIILNYYQKETLNTQIASLKTSTQALIHLTPNNQEILSHCYHLFIQGANLTILLNTPPKQLTPTYVANIVNILNTWYYNLCSLNITQGDSFISLMRTKKSEQIIQLTEQGLSKLHTLSPEQVALFSHFPQKYFCYGNVKWSEHSSLFINQAITSSNLDSLDAITQWQHHICKNSFLAFTPLDFDIEFQSWITLNELLSLNCSCNDNESVLRP